MSQEKAYQEIISVVGNDSSQPITVEHINQMKFLKAFVKETFRSAMLINVDLEIKKNGGLKGLRP